MKTPDFVFPAIILGLVSFQKLNGQEQICASNPSQPETCATETAIANFPAAAGQVNFKVNFARKPAPNNTLEKKGWYKAFWVFGDGNFRDFPGLPSDKASDETTLLQPYSYGATGNYTAGAFLTEKYSNTTPPGFAKISINSAAGAAAPPVERRTKALDSLISFIPAHVPRMNYPTIFAASWAKDLNPDRLVIFYNGYKSGTLIKKTLIPLNTAGNLVQPNYFSLPTGTVEQSTAVPGEFSGMGSKYANYVEFDLTQTSGTVPAFFDEKRLFPVFRTNEFRTNVTYKTAKMAFLAVLLGDSTNSKYNDLINYYSGTFKGKYDISPQKGRVFAHTFYMEKVLTAHDPNALVVDKIDDLGNNKFKVTFRLSIHNDGAIPEDSITLNVSDLSPEKLFSECAFLASNLVEPQHFSQNGSVSTVDFPGLVIPAVPEPYEPENVDVLFTMITNDRGVARLREPKENLRPIQACVIFSLSSDNKPECTLNTPVADDKKTDDKPCDWGDSWLVLLLASLGLLGLLGILIGWINKKKKPTN